MATKPKLKVLIIEDSRIFREIARESLLSYRDAVIDRQLVQTAKQGMELFNTYEPDLILLDIRLPDSNGLDALESILSLKPESFVVMMTASMEQKDITRAFAQGAMGYLLKPFNMHTMHKVLDQCILYSDAVRRAKEVSKTPDWTSLRGGFQSRYITNIEKE